MATGEFSITPWQIDGEKMETLTDFILGAPKSLQMVTAAMKLMTLAPWKESYDQPRQYIKKRWQEYTELYKKDLHDPDNHDGVITHLEPDILECEVK